ERGWKIERRDDLTRVMAAAVRGEPVGVYQDAGRADWWQPFGEWPASFRRLTSWPPPGDWAGLLAISDRLLPAVDRVPCVLYRPPSLVLGVGCKRGVLCPEIEATFQHVCRAHGFAPLSLGAVATAALKGDEPGLREFAAGRGVPLHTFSLEELAGVADLPTPSPAVRKKVGVWGVAEPAAMLAAAL